MTTTTTTTAAYSSSGISKKIKDEEVWTINESDSDQTLIYKRRRRSAIRGVILVLIAMMCLPTGLIVALVGRRNKEPMARFGYLLLTIGTVCMMLACDFWLPRMQDCCVDVIENGDQVVTTGGRCFMIYLDAIFVSPPFIGPLLGSMCLVTSIFLLCAYSVDSHKEVLLGAEITGGIGSFLCLLSYKAIAKIFR